MDSIDSLMGSMSLKKSKKLNEPIKMPSTSISQSTLSFNSQTPIKDTGFLSPKSPVFKPQQTPNDIMPEILLPLSEMDSEENDISERDIPDADYYARRKQHYSCPNGPTLNIWVGTGMKGSYGFDMVEEDDADMLSLDEPEQPRKLNGKAKVIASDLSNSKKTTIGGDVKRIRSQSENITACTIFKFMENAHLSQKRLI